MIFTGKAVKNGTQAAIKPAAGRPIATAGVTKGSLQAGSAPVLKLHSQGIGKAVAAAAGKALQSAKPVAPAPASGTVVPGSSLTTQCQDGPIATGNARSRSASSSCWW
jgi:hypothetical protein